jgi:hypothetical protein
MIRRQMGSKAAFVTPRDQLVEGSLRCGESSGGSRHISRVEDQHAGNQFIQRQAAMAARRRQDIHRQPPARVERLPIAHHLPASQQALRNRSARSRYAPHPPRAANRPWPRLPAPRHTTARHRPRLAPPGAGRPPRRDAACRSHTHPDWPLAPRAASPDCGECRGHHKPAKRPTRLARVPGSRAPGNASLFTLKGKWSGGAVPGECSGNASARQDGAAGERVTWRSYPAGPPDVVLCQPACHQASTQGLRTRQQMLIEITRLQQHFQVRRARRVIVDPAAVEDPRQGAYQIRPKAHRPQKAILQANRSVLSGGLGSGSRENRGLRPACPTPDASSRQAAHRPAAKIAPQNPEKNCARSAASSGKNPALPGPEENARAFVVAGPSTQSDARLRNVHPFRDRYSADRLRAQRAPTAPE